MPAVSSREKYLIFSFLCSVWAMLFALSFVLSEDPIHAWDLSRSHNSTIKLLEALDVSVLNFLNELRSSLSSSYNAVADLPPALLELLSGSTSRQHFILSLVICYLSPLCLMIPAYCWKFFGDQGERPLFLGLCLTFWSFLCVSFWPSILGGFTDLASLIPLLIALGLAVETDLAAKYDRRRMIAIGLCLYLAFMFRRWYIFAIGSFYLTALFFALGSLSRSGRCRETVKIIVKNLLTAGLATLIPMMIFQFPVFRGLLLNRYADKYAFYQTTVWESFLQIYATTGPLVLLAALISPLIGLVKKKRVKAWVFIVLCPLIFFIALTRIQGFGQHHTLGVTIYIWLAAFGGIVGLYLRLPRPGLKTILCLLVSLYLIICFKAAFSADPPTGPAAGLLPSIRITPLKHANFAGLEELMRDLEKLAGDSSTKIFVAASSMELNDHVIRNNIPALRQHILDNKGVDKRDGITVFQLMTARYVVVADPIRQVANPREQTVIIVPVEKIIQGQGLGRAYERLEKTYDLGRGLSAAIYEKKRAFSLAEVEDYIDSFPAGHENWTNPVSPTDKLLMTAEKVISNGVERLPFDRENRRGDYVIKSGLNPPTSISLNFEGLKRVKFSLHISAWRKVCGGRARVSVSVPGQAADEIELLAGETKVYDIVLPSPPQVTISSAGDDGTSCNRVFFRILESE